MYFYFIEQALVILIIFARNIDSQINFDDEDPRKKSRAETQAEYGFKHRLEPLTFKNHLCNQTMFY